MFQKFDEIVLGMLASHRIDCPQFFHFSIDCLQSRYQIVDLDLISEKRLDLLFLLSGHSQVHLCKNLCFESVKHLTGKSQSKVLYSYSLMLIKSLYFESYFGLSSRFDAVVALPSVA